MYRDRDLLIHEMTPGTDGSEEALGLALASAGALRRQRGGEQVLAARLGRQTEQATDLALNAARAVGVEEGREERVEQNGHQRQVVGVGRQASQASLGQGVQHQHHVVGQPAEDDQHQHEHRHASCSFHQNISSIFFFFIFSNFFILVN